MIGAVAVVRNTGSKLRTATTEQRTDCIELRTDRRDRRPKQLTGAGMLTTSIEPRSPKKDALGIGIKESDSFCTYLGCHERKKREHTN